jgi:HAD superfamily hydrolase (TIGR01450 family)
MVERRQDAVPLAEQYDVAMLDLDGVVYRGDQAVTGAVDALAGALGRGMGRVFVTNNASRTPRTVAAQLTRLGVRADDADVVTSAQAAAGRLTQLLPVGSRVLVVGGDGLLEAVRERGLQPVGSAEDEPDAVVQGFSPTTTWQMLMEACVVVRAGRPWVVTNADATLPTPRGEGPGNGALVDVVRRVTGREPTEVTGKPFAPIMDEARRRRHARRPLVVGDRLDTDIEAAHAAGMDSLLVLTGVSRLDDLLDAPPARRPTFVAPDLAGLLRPGHAVRDEGGAWRCGDVAVCLSASEGAPQVRVDVTTHGGAAGDGDDVMAADVLHAGAAAWWSCDEKTESLRAQVRAALSPWAAPYGWDG